MAGYFLLKSLSLRERSWTRPPVLIASAHRFDEASLGLRVGHQELVCRNCRFSGDGEANDTHILKMPRLSHSAKRKVDATQHAQGHRPLPCFRRCSLGDSCGASEGAEQATLLAAVLRWQDHPASQRATHRILAANAVSVRHKGPPA